MKTRESVYILQRIELKGPGVANEFKVYENRREVAREHAKLAQWTLSYNSHVSVDHCYRRAQAGDIWPSSANTVACHDEHHLLSSTENKHTTKYLQRCF